MEKNELADELRNMLLRLAHINDCFLLYKKLLDYERTMNREMNIAPAFFQIVMYSLEHTYIIDIFKLYDRDRNAKGIRKAVNLCEQNSALFPRERIMFIDEELGIKDVVKINIIKDVRIIREKLSALDPVIISLKGRRDGYYAHNDKNFIDNLHSLAIKYPLSLREISDLILTANEILNTLLRDLTGEVVATKSSNYDDIDNIFKILNTQIKNKYNTSLTNDFD